MQIPLSSTSLAPSAACAAPVPTWQQAMRQAIRRPEDLRHSLQLTEEQLPIASAACGGFPLFVPWEFQRRIRPADPHDPLLRQVWPAPEEDAIVPGFHQDPVQERNLISHPGLLRKYHGRALIVTTGACAVHCRYCFRRHFPYDSVGKSLEDWLPAIESIAADSSLEEVILSGGDPWTIVDSLLEELVDAVQSIPHVRRLRFHTRLPILIPQRVTSRLIDLVSGMRIACVVVIHGNHPAELDDGVAGALARLHSAGAMLLNQAVLLRGVNDDVQTLADLSAKLIDLRCSPYYLHQLDPVAGGAHFLVPVERGRQIVTELRKRMPGYAVPRYVQEIPGEPYKVLLD